MSLVVACVTNNRIVFKCDSHPLVGGTSENDGKKMQKIDDSILFGFTGDKDFCETALTAFLRLHMVAQMSQAPLTDLVEMFQAKMISFYAKDKKECSFVIGGRQDNMLLIFGLSSHNDFEINMQFTTQEFDEEDIECFVIGDKLQNECMTFEQFFRSVEKQPIESVMNQYILYMASKEESVSDIIYTEKIKA